MKSEEITLAQEIKEYYLGQSLFNQVGHMTTYDIRQMSEKYPQCRQTDVGIPIFGMIDALNTELKAYRDTFGLDANKTTEENKQERAMKHENILSKKILNQAKLSLLIPKAQATERVKGVFRAVMNTVKHAIKMAAPKLIELTDQRDIEQVLSDSWNEAVKKLEQASKVISWEEYGSADLLRTRLVDIEEQDPEFAKVIKGGSDEQSKD
jgi:hypothetical protein